MATLDEQTKVYMQKYQELYAEFGPALRKYPVVKYDFPNKDRFHDWIDRALHWARGERLVDGPPTDYQHWVLGILKKRSMLEKIPAHAFDYDHPQLLTTAQEAVHRQAFEITFGTTPEAAMQRDSFIRLDMDMTERAGDWWHDLANKGAPEGIRQLPSIDNSEEANNYRTKLREGMIDWALAVECGEVPLNLVMKKLKRLGAFPPRVQYKKRRLEVRPGIPLTVQHNWAPHFPMDDIPPRITKMPRTDVVAAADPRARSKQ